MYPNSGLWPKSSSSHMGHFPEYSWQLLMSQDEGLGPQSAINCTSDLQDLCMLNFMWILHTPSRLHRIRDYISGKSLCNHRDSVLKMKDVRTQVFRNYLREFYQQVVYKFKTRNITSKDSSLSNFEKFTLVLFVVLFTNF